MRLGVGQHVNHAPHGLELLCSHPILNPSLTAQGRRDLFIHRVPESRHQALLGINTNGTQRKGAGSRLVPDTVGPPTRVANPSASWTRNDDQHSVHLRLCQPGCPAMLFHVVDPPSQPPL